jgi:hypothetical protein
MPRKKPGAVSIGKFDILATYVYSKALLDGLNESEAKERARVAAIMGPRPGLATPAAITRRTSRRPRRRRSQPSTRIRSTVKSRTR